MILTRGGNRAMPDMAHARHMRLGTGPARLAGMAPRTRAVLVPIRTGTIFLIFLITILFNNLV